MTQLEKRLDSKIIDSIRESEEINLVATRLMILMSLKADAISRLNFAWIRGQVDLEALDTIIDHNGYVYGVVDAKPVEFVGKDQEHLNLEIRARLIAPACRNHEVEGINHWINLTSKLVLVVYSGPMTSCKERTTYVQFVSPLETPVSNVVAIDCTPSLPGFSHFMQNPSVKVFDSSS